MQHIGLQLLYKNYIRQDLEAMRTYAEEYKDAKNKNYTHTADLCKYMIAYHGKWIKYYQDKLKQYGTY